MVSFRSEAFAQLPRTQLRRAPSRNAQTRLLSCVRILLRLATVSCGALRQTWTDGTGVFPRLLLRNGGWVTTCAFILRTVRAQCSASCANGSKRRRLHRRFPQHNWGRKWQQSSLSLLQGPTGRSLTILEGRLHGGSQLTGGELAVPTILRP